MKKAPQTPNENEVVSSQETANKKPITKRIKDAFLNRYTALILGGTTLVGCDPDDPIEPQNQAPTVTLTNVVSNDDTNTVSGKLTATDSDGTVTSKTLQAETTDGTRVNIALNADGTFSHTFTNSGKTFDTLLAKAKDDDNATKEAYKNLTPVVEVETPNQAPTITVDLDDFDENTPIGTVVGNINASDPDGDTLTYEIIEGGDKFELDGLNVKTKVAFNHEDLDNTHTVKVRVSDGDLTAEAQDTATENDLQEVQNIDLYGDGGLLPNGEKYAIKADEEETGQTLPIEFYSHGNSRISEADIESFIVDSSENYSEAQDDIIDLYGTGIGPEYSNGQQMVSFDGGTNEMVIHAEDGSELNRVGRTIYGKMMVKIKQAVGTNDTIQFVQNGTDLNTVWEDMIVLHTKHSTNLYVGCHKAIQNYLAQ